MHRTKFLVLFFIILFVFINTGIAQEKTEKLSSIQPGNLGQWVRPFVGTGGIPWVCGFNFPGATLPFGMIRLSPDTPFNGAPNTAGYYYDDDTIVGFSHTRLSGTGATDGGHFLIVPTNGPVSQETRLDGQYARFSHQREKAFPGYYAVELLDLDIMAELTATKRVGVHRYTFAAEKEPHLLLDVSNVLGKAKSKDGQVRILPQSREIEGKIHTFGTFAGRFGGIKVYFVARFNQDFHDYGVWNQEQFFTGKREIAGDEIGADLKFSQRIVEVQLAISYVSIENARANLEAEAIGDFDLICTNAIEQWEKTLALVKTEGGTDKEKAIFYTSLYHSFAMPTIFNDVNGEYIGFDKQVHKASGFEYYTDLSIWDTFRTLHPLLVLVTRKEQRDMVVSLVEMIKQGGWLPRWPSGYGYTNSMFGTPGDIVIAGSYLKGITDFDIETAYRSIRETALAATPAKSPFSGREQIEHYSAFQYCPSDKGKESVAKTLEFAYTDYTISLLARKLGYINDAEIFAERAKYYKNLWNPKTQYFQPRNSSGTFVEPFYPKLLTYFDPEGKHTEAYVEGCALHWRWAVFHDVQGLISLFKSREHFVKELNAFFAGANNKVGDIPNAYYWHGNEHDLHAVYLFNAAARPDLTQKWVRWIMDKKYSTKANGIDGNDDGGTLSAWYVFSALGFYPIAGTERYYLGSPIFHKAEMDLQGKKLVIIAENYSPKNIYVKRVLLNNMPLDRNWISHNEIAQGGILVFEMTAKPQRRW